MESNLCNDNHLDSNVLLPPRKRLLAGFKKQNFDSNSDQPSTSSKNGVFDARMDNLVKYHLQNPKVSLEEIVEASNRAAKEAVKVAEAARALAEEKAVVAAKAMAGAKSALELVATIFEENYGEERFSKKNKMKKHLPVRLLYNKHRSIENCKTDEELARKLHQAMNSSPRISKNSNLKSYKHKKLKGLSAVEEHRHTSNGHSEADQTDSEDLADEHQAIMVHDNSSKWIDNNSLKILNGKVESSHSKETLSGSSEDSSSVGRKRGRMKQKKLPLSICSIKDLANMKEDLKLKNAQENGVNIMDSTGKNNACPSDVGPHKDSVKPVQPTLTWKCKAFKTSMCIKQNKVTSPDA